MSLITIHVNNYVHSAANRNTAAFTHRRTENLHPSTNRRTHFTEILSLTTIVRRDTQAELTDALEELRAAHVNGVDVVVYDNNGEQTVHVLRNSQTLNGVRARVKEYPAGSHLYGPRMEYVNTRTVRTVFVAEILDADSDVVAFHQSIRQVSRGTGDFVIQEGFFSPPIRQDTLHATKFAVVQSGYAEGMIDYPTFPASIALASLKPRPFVAEMLTPKNIGSIQHSRFPIIWSYYHEGTNGLLVQPPPLLV